MLWAVWLTTQGSKYLQARVSEVCHPNCRALESCSKEKQCTLRFHPQPSRPGALLPRLPHPPSLLGLRATWPMPTNQAGQSPGGTRPALASWSVMEGTCGRRSSQWRAEPANPSGGRRLGKVRRQAPLVCALKTHIPARSKAQSRGSWTAPPLGQAVSGPWTRSCRDACLGPW